MSCCPSLEQLQHLLADRLSESETDAIEAHLETCASCQRLLDRLTGQSTGVEAPESTTLQPGFLHRLVKTPPTAFRAPAETSAVADNLTTNRERYAVTRLHAQGGIGQVWLARDQDLGRVVALKELRSEFAGHADAWARFLAEARITGQLEHPGIVPVYELARHGDGAEPFYAMRFVGGRTLASAIRSYHEKRAAGAAGSAELRELLGAFVSVCNAVAYAHSRGVIHRDLKGHNIVLGDYGEVIVLDWGLAKVLGGADREVGPDLISAGAQAIRDQTLQGAVLGTPQYMAPEQAEGRLDAVDRRSDVYSLGAILYEILAGEPPFTGVATEELLRRVIAEPPIPPRARVPTTPPGLNAVCLKALAKAPADRYTSVRDLAADVQRWLADEPISAWPEPWSVRARRWAVRHRTGVSTAAAALLVALVCLAVATSLLAAANGREQAAKQEAVVERDRALQQRDRADKNLASARKAVEDYCTHVAADSRLQQGDFHALRKQLLQTAVTFYLDFVKQKAGDPALQADHARAYQQLSVLRKTIGEAKDALVDCQQATGILERLVDQNAGNADFRHELARSRTSLGNVLDDLGRRTEAEAQHRRALALWMQLAADFPQVPEYRLGLARSRIGLANMLAALGRGAVAEAEYRKALTLEEQLTMDWPHVEEYRRELARSRANLGLVLARRGRHADAETEYRTALTLQEQLAADSPRTPEYRVELSQSYNSLALLMSDLRRWADEETALRRAQPLQEQLTADFPLVPTYRQQLAVTHNNLGNALDELGRQADAQAEYHKALHLQEQLAAGFPHIPDYRQDLARSRINLGLLLARLARTTDADADYRKGLVLYEKLVADFPQIQDYALEFGAACNNYGELVEHGNRPEAALAWYDKSIALQEPILAKEPKLVAARTGLRDAQSGKARTLARLGRQTDATALAEPLAADTDLDPEQLFKFACTYAILSTKVEPRGARSSEYAARAVALLQRARASGYFREPDASRLLEDDDLAALRTRDDFKHLLSQVRRASGATPP
jgi:serine/threonine-protein kinase